MEDLTKKLIADTTEELMKKKPISQIRISEICKICKIQRTTFYYHFRDKYELVAWIFFRDADSTSITDLDSAANALNEMKRKTAFYKQAYADNSQNALWKYMVDYFEKRYDKLVADKLAPDQLPFALKYQIRLYCYGCVAMTKEWVLGDEPFSGRDAAQLMFDSMPEELHSICFS